MSPDLSDQEKARYLRQLQLNDFGLDAQLKLKSSQVLVVGMGGLGCPVAQYLAAAGVGVLTLIDADHVSLSNLHRQPLYNQSELNKSKVEVAQKKLASLNTDIAISARRENLNLDNVEALVSEHDLVIDCTDNFETRYLINDFCTELGIPWIFGSVLRESGQFALFQPEGPCFRCLFPTVTDVPDCNQAGVIGVLPGVIGSLQATLAIDYLTSPEKHQKTDLHIFSSKNFQIKNIGLQKDSGCACSEKINLSKKHKNSLGNDELEKHLIDIKSFLSLRKNENMHLIDVRSDEEHQRFNIGGQLIPSDTWHKEIKLPEEKLTVLYCQSGVRSQNILKTFILNTDLKSDFRVRSLKGGLDALQDYQRS